METLSLPHLLVIGAVLVLLFGGKKIPEVMRGLGEGIHHFKEGMRGEVHGPTQTTQVSPPTSTSTPATEEKK
jgi:sec-independent protein translocase protein TatA